MIGRTLRLEFRTVSPSFEAPCTRDHPELSEPSVRALIEAVEMTHDVTGSGELDELALRLRCWAGGPGRARTARDGEQRARAGGEAGPAVQQFARQRTLQQILAEERR